LKKSTFSKLLTGMSLAALITAGSLPLMAQEKTGTSCGANMKKTSTATAKKTTAKSTTQKAKTSKTTKKTGSATTSDTTKK